MNMADKTRDKLTLIFDNYLNGNRKNATLAIRRLTKLELAQLIINMPYLHMFHETEKNSEFENFIINSLGGR